MDELTLGGPGRSGRCTRRVLDSNLHCTRPLTRAARRPQRPALPRRPSKSTRSGRPDASFFTFTHNLSTSSLYYHSLSWTPSLPTFPYHPTFLLSYFPTLTVHLLPILSPTQLDTLPSQCELRLVRLQQRQRRVLERGPRALAFSLLIVNYFSL